MKLALIRRQLASKDGDEFYLLQRQLAALPALGPFAAGPECNFQAHPQSYTFRKNSVIASATRCRWLRR